MLLFLRSRYQFFLKIQGFFDAFIFLLDPGVIFCLKTYRQYLSKKYVVQYHSVDDSGRSTDIPYFPNKGISIKWKKRILFRRPVSLPGKISWPFLSYHVVRVFIFNIKDLNSNENKKDSQKPKSNRDTLMEDKNQIKIIKYSKKTEEKDDTLEAYNETPHQNPAEPTIEKDDELLALNNIDI